MSSDPIAVTYNLDPLRELARRIQAEHSAVVTAMVKGINHARSAGELLIKAKSLCRHGEWLPWLAVNCPDIGIRQAQKYMRLAEKWASLTEPASNANSGAHLPINSALAILAEPKSDAADGAFTPPHGTRQEPDFSSDRWYGVAEITRFGRQDRLIFLTSPYETDRRFVWYMATLIPITFPNPGGGADAISARKPQPPDLLPHALASLGIDPDLFSQLTWCLLAGGPEKENPWP